MITMERNLFERAIKKRELLMFAQGQGEYFIQDREYNEHWILGSWINHIEPLYEQDKKLCKHGLLLMFHGLLNDESNCDSIIESLLYHIYVVYYLMSEGRLQEIRLLIEDLEPDIIGKINIYKSLSAASKNNEINISLKMIKNKGGLKGLDISK